MLAPKATAAARVSAKSQSDRDLDLYNIINLVLKSFTIDKNKSSPIILRV